MRIATGMYRGLLPLLLLLGLNAAARDVAAAAAAVAPPDWPGNRLCRTWTVVHVAGHPEWPGHFLEAAAACEGNGGESHPAATNGQVGRTIRLRFVTDGAEAEIRVTALEAGGSGDVVRFRSSLNDAILWGRLRTDGGADLVLRPGRDRERLIGNW